MYQNSGLHHKTHQKMSKTEMEIWWSFGGGFFSVSIFKNLLAEHLKISNSMISNENVKIMRNNSGALGSVSFYGWIQWS